jgi:Asp-tRNA(Asn)/Glu-tRNA(Gln) amidotransferase A subunit family amidase
MVAGHLSSEALVRSCLRRIAEREPDVRAWAVIDPDHAIRSAREADKIRQFGATKLGPLHGVPFGVKDVIDTAEFPTQYNSVIFRGRRTDTDASVVALLRAAGAIVLGKTETTEFAADGRTALTRNPHDLSRTPGGSSSGSAAAVADLMVPLALGTQTGGSCIRPGAFCGVVAFKPTHGTVSTEGVKRFSGSLDTVGWYARSVADIALLAEVLEVSHQPIPHPIEPRLLRIGICRTPFWSDALPATRSAMAQAIDRLGAAGATLEEVDLDRELLEVNGLQTTVMSAEGRFSFLNLLHAYPDRLSPGIRTWMKRISNHELRAALDRAAALRPAFDKVAERFDAILTPSASGEAPVGLGQTPGYGKPVFNQTWTLLHAPCITLPGFLGPAGLPVGMQLVAPRYADGLLLAAATTVSSVLFDEQ